MKPSLETVVGRLAKLYRPPEPLTDPLAILVWENIGYLIDDTRRAELFSEFQKKIGLSAHRIANAPMPILTDIAKRGGMHPQKRAERLIEKGAIAALIAEGSNDAEWLKRAYMVLREHGKSLCKRSAPLCEPCPLDAVCAHRPVSANM